MTRFFLPDGGDDEICEILVGGARPEKSLQVVVGQRKEAGSEVAIRRDPNPVAAIAEWLTDGGDDPDRSASVGEVMDGRRLRPVALFASQRIDRMHPGVNLGAGHDRVHGPPPLRVERHILDEADLNVLLAPQTCEIGDLIVVVAPHDDAVQLDGVQTGFPRESDPRQDLRHQLAVSPHHALEALRPERIQADIDTLEARIRQTPDLLQQEEPVGGHGEVQARIQPDQPGDQHLDILPHQRLPTGQSDRVDSETDKDARQVQDLLIGQDLASGKPGQALGRHAVDAAEVASIGEGDPEVVDGSPERILQSRHNALPISEWPGVAAPTLRAVRQRAAAPATPPGPAYPGSDRTPRRAAPSDRTPAPCG